jgi:hypothetical protein
VVSHPFHKEREMDGARSNRRNRNRTGKEGLVPTLRGGTSRLGRFPRIASAWRTSSWAIILSSLREELLR